MRRPLLLRLSLTVLLSADVLAQTPVSIQFQTDPVVVQTGTGIVFTVLTVPQVFSMSWQYQGTAVGLWTGGNSQINPGTQFAGRATITATQLQIGSATLQDAGNYTVTVTPTGTTMLQNSRSVQLKVFDAVVGVSLTVSSPAIEGRNVSLTCTWTAGTAITVQWGKDGVAVSNSSRITVSGGSLFINPAQRGDTGTYTCTASNPVSAQTASTAVTVYYGPDTPVLTKENSNACVGGGDVAAGQTVALTCTSSSLPPALYTWQFNGQPVTSSQSANGVLTLQTYSTNQSGQYFCTARNSISGNAATQGTVLTVVGTCLSAGQVAGIVVGSFLTLVIIVLLIVLIVYLCRKGRAPPREGETVVAPKTDPQTRPSDPQPNGARELGQGPNPPLYGIADRTQQLDRRVLQQNGLQNSNNARTERNGLLHNAVQTMDTGTDNPAFEPTDVHNANTQTRNPNIVIQTGAAQGGAQLPAVHVNLTALPQAAQQNGNGQMPAIHLNLNSLPTNGQTQQDASMPLASAANNQLHQANARQSNPREQSGQSHPGERTPNTHVDNHTGNPHQPGPIPTGYTHYNGSSPSQRNANTQTYQQETRRGRSDGTANPSRQQMSWYLLRGTPSYPSGTLPRRQFPPVDNSDTTDYSDSDYTTHPPLRETRIPNRPQPRDGTRSRAPTSRDGPSVDGRARSRSADSLNPSPRSVTQVEAADRAQENRRPQRERAQRDIRAGGQTAPRQETTHSNNPQALPLTSQQASVARSAVSQGPTNQQGLHVPRGTDTRALADPNHLPQAHMAQPQRAAQVQITHQGLDRRTQPVTGDASQPLQGGRVPVQQPPAQANPSNLTQAALEAHTKKAQTFQNRRQQTQAALLHPGTHAARVQQPPTPPPVIPLTEFRSLPKDRAQHKSPTRVPQPSRPPANMPLGQRPPKHRANAQPHPATMVATHHHHHHPGRGPMPVSTNRNPHVPGHGHPTHFTQHPQQAHRGRPR